VFEISGEICYFASMDYTAKIDSGGKILISSQLRKVIELEVGDDVIRREDYSQIARRLAIKNRS
jgi:bifunctional DNA-binding transcriptional regulator/antitoxin component of YhaV-PrlF toxin-antitoxin module